MDTYHKKEQPQTAGYQQVSAGIEKVFVSEEVYEKQKASYREM